MNVQLHGQLRPGLRFSWHYTVPERASVPALYQDTDFCRDMPAVLATGYLVGMMELACVNGIMPYMDWPHQQSLGTMVNFRHLAPTPPGMRLRIEGEVLEVAGRRITFKVQAWDDVERVCEGTHERMLIDADRFNDKVARKVAAP
ncbi:MAG: thioesterase [Massilia sp.]|jgi:fluoroacetyl-CoA thioesterase|nr:thioesterase [Massilia sp.]